MSNGSVTPLSTGSTSSLEYEGTNMFIDITGVPDLPLIIHRYNNYLRVNDDTIGDIPFQYPPRHYQYIDGPNYFLVRSRHDGHLAAVLTAMQSEMSSVAIPRDGNQPELEPIWRSIDHLQQSPGTTASGSDICLSSACLSESNQYVEQFDGWENEWPYTIPRSHPPQPPRYNNCSSTTLLGKYLEHLAEHLKQVFEEEDIEQ
ncbi:348_t:CDS:2 [Paraglomus occultum]|uniref:348_t:CDS:1 n=1 Tax=Paraglomus occultum TaxID=144539 RepID=A0A9N9E251_9GLOM|nr:348_t:CDS:2 [Paraglomus occultum]